MAASRHSLAEGGALRKLRARRKNSFLRLLARVDDHCETLVMALGTVALHCPVARLVSESFLMSLGPYRYRSRSANQICPEPRLKFVLILMVGNLKNSFVFATLAFLTACHTPQASNQQDRPARNGQSSSPSSQYEVEPISGIQRPLGAPGTFQPGSGRGP